MNILSKKTVVLPKTLVTIESKSEVAIESFKKITDGINEVISDAEELIVNNNLEIDLLEKKIKDLKETNEKAVSIIGTQKGRLTKINSLLDAE